MKIRNATIDDLPKIVAIYNATINSGMVTADTIPVTVESRISWFEQHNATNRPLWIAESDTEEMIGWLSFNNFYGRPAYQITAEISLYLHQDFLHQGYGSTLLLEAIKTSPTLGLENLLGFIFADNHQSIALFKKYGFEIWGELKEIARNGDEYKTLLILGRKIPD